MSSATPRITAVVILFAFVGYCGGLISVSHAQERKQYAIKVDSKINMEMSIGTQTIEALSQFAFFRQQKGEKILTGIDSGGFKAKFNGRTISNLTMDATKASDPITGISFTPDDGSERGKSLKSFGQPILEISVDSIGQETGRKLVMDKDNPLLVKTGEYHHIMLFHAPFDEKAKKWTAPVLFSIGEGEVLKGTMAYELKSREGDKVTVATSAKLTGKMSRRGIKCKDVAYTLTGLQVYDLKTKDWSSGKLNVKLKFVMIQNGKELATATGTMDFDFSTGRPQPKSAKADK